MGDLIHVAMMSGMIYRCLTKFDFVEETVLGSKGTRLEGRVGGLVANNIAHTHTHIHTQRSQTHMCKRKLQKRRKISNQGGIKQTYQVWQTSSLVPLPFPEYHLHNSTTLLLTHPQHLGQILLHLSLDLRIRILLLPSTTTTTLILLLLLPTLLIIHLRICIPSLIPLLLVLLLPITLMIPTSMLRLQMLRHDRRPPRQINIHPPRILLRRILQPQLLTNLLDLRFDFLDMIRRMVPLAHNPTIIHTSEHYWNPLGQSSAHTHTHNSHM